MKSKPVISNNKTAVKNLIKYFGNQKAVGEALGTSQVAVSNWLKNKNRIDVVRALKAEKLTNGAVKATDLCPRLKEV